MAAGADEVLTMADRGEEAYRKAMAEMVDVVPPVVEEVGRRRTEWDTLSRAEREAYSPLRAGPSHGSYLAEVREERNDG